MYFLLLTSQENIFQLGILLHPPSPPTTHTQPLSSTHCRECPQVVLNLMNAGGQRKWLHNLPGPRLHLPQTHGKFPLVRAGLSVLPVNIHDSNSDKHHHCLLDTWCGCALLEAPLNPHHTPMAKRYCHHPCFTAEKREAQSLSKFLRVKELASGRTGTCRQSPTSSPVLHGPEHRPAWRRDCWVNGVSERPSGHPVPLQFWISECLLFHSGCSRSFGYCFSFFYYCWTSHCPFLILGWWGEDRQAQWPAYLLGVCSQVLWVGGEN